MRLLALVCLAACSNHLSELGKTGEPFGRFANLRMGMKADEVAKLVPGMKPDPKDPTHLSIDAEDGARYDAYFLNDHVSKLEIQAPRRVTRDELERAWGKPRQVDS